MAGGPGLGALMKSSLRIVLTILVMGAACRKAAEAPSPASGSETVALPMPSQGQAPSEKAAALDPGLAEDVRDRRLMVRSAPAGFKPKAQGQELEVRLIPEAARIKLGTPLRIRLEVQNIGTERWWYMGEHSLLKSRASNDNDWAHWKFYAKGADGKRIELNGAIGGSSLVEAQVIEPAAAQRLLERVRAFRYLDIDLAPGETIVSLPRTGDVADDWVPTEEDRYVEVANAFEFKKAGIYEIQTEHTARKFNPERKDFDPERKFNAAPIRIEVVP